MTEERKSENALRKPRVDVVIPTYKPGKKIFQTFKNAGETDLSHREDHCNEYRKGILNEKGFEGISNLQVHHLTKAEFDHGATRNRGNAFFTG